MNKLEKINPLLYQKIIQYNSQKNQDPLLIRQFNKQKQILLLDIQEKTKKQTSNFIFPRKVHQNEKFHDPQENILNEELSQKTYNLYSQNDNKTNLNHNKNSSFFISKPFSKNQIVVRKNHQLHKQNYQNQNHVTSQFVKSCHDKSPKANLLNKNDDFVPNDFDSNKSQNDNVKRSIFKKVTNIKRQFNSPQSYKAEKMKLNRQFSGNSLRSAKQNKLPSLDKTEADWKKPLKSRFNQDRPYDKLKIQVENDC